VNRHQLRAAHHKTDGTGGMHERSVPEGVVALLTLWSAASLRYTGRRPEVVTLFYSMDSRHSEQALGQHTGQHHRGSRHP
jgi:hypothetical protein